jgi:hypothetical protein
MSVEANPAAAAAAARGARLALLCVVVITAAVMLPVCFNGFVLWDDPITVACNAQMAPMTWRSVRFWWTGPVLDLYAPLTYTVWGVISLAAHVPTDAVSGISQDPLPYHVANLVCHVGATAALFAILLRLVRRPWAAAAGALVFGVHPIQVETVAWVTALNGGLCAALGLAAVWQYLRFTDADAPRARRAARYACATVLLALALLAKPSGVVFAPIAAAIDLVMLRRPWRRVGAALAPWFALAGGAALLASRVQAQARFDVVYPWLDRVLVSGDTLVFYAGKVLCPWRLGIVYGRTPTVAVNGPWIYYECLGVVAAAALLARYRPLGVLAGAAVFVLGMLPVIGLFRFTFQSLFSSVADRYAYVPMAGVALAAAWLLARPWYGASGRRARAIGLGCALVLALLIGLTERQIRTWRDSQSLFAQSNLVHPRPAMARWPGTLRWSPRHEEKRTLSGELEGPR